MCETESILKNLKSESKYYVGIKQLKRAVEKEKISYIVLANDAEESFKNQVEQISQQINVKVITVPKMKELGEVVGVSVPSAVVTVISD